MCLNEDNEFLLISGCYVFGFYVDICIAFETEKGPQVSILLEYLPSWIGICNSCSWHYQRVQRI